MAAAWDQGWHGWCHLIHCASPIVGCGCLNQTNCSAKPLCTNSKWYICLYSCCIEHIKRTGAPGHSLNFYSANKHCNEGQSKVHQITCYLDSILAMKNYKNTH